MSKKSSAKNARPLDRPLGADYLKLVEWSDEDGCYIGSAPPLVGPSCHGDDPTDVFRQISEIVEEHLQIRHEDGLPIPPPTVQRQHSGKFNLRTGPDLHKMLEIRATQAGESLNTYCVRELTKAVSTKPC